MHGVQGDKKFPKHEIERNKKSKQNRNKFDIKHIDFVFMNLAGAFYMPNKPK